MDDEYLWDRSGEPDPAIAGVERTLEVLAFHRTDEPVLAPGSWAPSEDRRASRVARWIGPIGWAVAAALALAWWMAPPETVEVAVPVAGPSASTVESVDCDRVESAAQRPVQGAEQEHTVLESPGAEHEVEDVVRAILVESPGGTDSRLGALLSELESMLSRSKDDPELRMHVQSMVRDWNAC